MDEILVFILMLSKIMKTVCSYFTRRELDLIVSALYLYLDEWLSEEHSPEENVQEYSDMIEDLHDRFCHLSSLEDIRLSITDLNILSVSTYRYFASGKVSFLDYIVFASLQRILFLDQAEYFVVHG